ncbi:MAG: hypothetical protein ABIC57_03390 [bacterium]
MKKLSVFLSTVGPWLLGLVIITGIPYGYFKLTNTTFWDLIYTSEITISDGNVVKKYSNDREIILVNKEDFEEDGIERFSYVSVSPDGDKMCFLGHTVAPIWGYWSDINGNDVVQVGIAENCIWSSSTEYIAYTNHTTDVSSHNVYLYSLETDESENMTESLIGEEMMRRYEAPEWSQDDSFILSDYTEYDNAMEETASGTTKITVETGALEEYE